MPCDIDALRIRLKKIYNEEKQNRRHIIFLEDPPVINCQRVVSKIKKTKVQKKKDVVVSDDTKTKKAIEFIEMNYISKMLEDMKPFARAVETKNKRELSKLSVTLKVDLGKLYGIPGAYHKTEDPEIDNIIQRINKVRFE